MASATCSRVLPPRMAAACASSSASRRPRWSTTRGRSARWPAMAPRGGCAQGRGDPASTCSSSTRRRPEWRRRCAHACPARASSRATASCCSGFAVSLPARQVARLATVPGVARVYPNLRYHALTDTGRACSTRRCSGEPRRLPRARASRSASSTTGSTARTRSSRPPASPRRRLPARTGCVHERQGHRRARLRAAGLGRAQPPAVRLEGLVPRHARGGHRGRPLRHAGARPGSSRRCPG